MATRDDVRHAWRLLAAAYPTFGLQVDTTVLAESLDLYERMFVDVPAEALMAGTLRHIATSRFWPTVCELREQTLAVCDGHPDAAVAWQIVRDAMLDGRTSSARMPLFEDAQITATVVALGWRDLCGSDNLVADRAHFLQAFTRLCQRERLDTVVPRLLAGIPGVMGSTLPVLPGPRGPGYSLVDVEPREGKGNG